MAAVESQRVQNAYTVLNREFELPAVPIAPPAYVPRIASTLEISGSTRRRAAALARLAVHVGVANGCNPAGVAAGCVYQAVQERDDRVTQAALADAADISSMTVRARWTDLLAVLESKND
jgi:transcription initiation factor TFIIB